MRDGLTDQGLREARTTLHRQARLQLVRDGNGNMEVLRAIERSLFVVCLDGACPASLDDVRTETARVLHSIPVPTAACT